MIPADPELDLPAVAAGFDLPGKWQSGARYGSGHINDTFLITQVERGILQRTVLQRLNRHVFPDPSGLMANFARVTRHLRRKLADEGLADLDRRVLTLVPARDGGDSVTDAHGEIWRATRFIEGGVSVEVATGPEVTFQIGRAFGDFLRLISDLDTPRLIETIPGFHDTESRVAALRRMIAADPLARTAGAGAEIDFALSRVEWTLCLPTLAAGGELSEQVVHNDTKINNVLLDAISGEGLCVLDLDTVMPGLPAFDFGELVRSSVFRVAEDVADSAMVALDLTLFEALARGFQAGARTRFSPAEREALEIAGTVMSYENGVRFLTDHLDGDRYFRIHRPGQNLDRARNHFARVRSLERHRHELARVLDSLTLKDSPPAILPGR